MAITNRQMLIEGLQDKKQDEYTTSYIDCPYIHTDDCLNHDKGVEYGDGVAWNENCVECKIAWLDKEFEG